jgi:hypothetical protein
MRSKHFFGPLLDPYHSVNLDEATAPEELQFRRKKHESPLLPRKKPQA